MRFNLCQEIVVSNFQNIALKSFYRITIHLNVGAYRLLIWLINLKSSQQSHFRYRNTYESKHTVNYSTLKREKITDLNRKNLSILNNGGRTGTGADLERESRRAEERQLDILENSFNLLTLGG